MNKTENNTQTVTRIAEMCYVYAKMKWMQTFKAFDLDGFFPGKLIYASLLEDSEENRIKLQKLADDNRQAEFVFQLRKDNKVVFQTT